ncbi:MAG: hypothetical protein B6D44_17205 [Ignavibacteriales bacterium UTCHB2]|jgi:hypothetical protein|nr:MAG: hypothetical protein BWY38_02747 [Ignavibacteria bacterium ADurb.Bin266]OQY69771.1 MAG: hypothetical protein B6D44_17205 [Ignavibacteriales bacterium UTCHB2]HQI42180.1 hypothetical protein [Ignavibacteriaceae bacterium]
MPGVIDFSQIIKAVDTVNHNVILVNSNLGILSDVQKAMAHKQDTMAIKQDAMEIVLNQLMQAFIDFVALDTKQKNLQLAETRVGNSRQELQIKFGYYAEIRRMATGILQGVDTGVVGNETIKSTTEEVMIKAPSYWLAPVLVTIASWIRDDKAICDKALTEALKRDDYKSTLFFMLLTRRLGRNDASLIWLERYFIHQNPHNLDREFITVLEAVTTGVFHPAGRIVMMNFVKNWLDQLTQGDKFINEQKNQWIKFFEALKPPLKSDKYPLLRQFATNWIDLETSLREVLSYEISHGHFNSIISSSYDFSDTIKVKLDQILTQLVTNFDDEELPLQKEVRLNQLIIEKEGDKDAAQAVIDAEENIFKEKVDFLQMLTNAAFNPEAAGVTKVTQALAVSISQPWIIEAFDTFTARNRNKVTQTVELVIDGFSTATRNGSDEKEQISKLENYFTTEMEKGLAAIPFPIGMIILGVLIGLSGLIFKTPLALLITIAIGVVIIWNNLSNVNKKKNQIKNIFEERKKKAKEVLRGCLAETVDYRKELAMEDAKSESVRQLLKSITPQDFSSLSQDTARSIV